MKVNPNAVDAHISGMARFHVEMIKNLYEAQLEENSTLKQQLRDTLRENLENSNLKEKLAETEKKLSALKQQHAERTM